MTIMISGRKVCDYIVHSIKDGATIPNSSKVCTRPLYWLFVSPLGRNLKFPRAQSLHAFVKGVASTSI